jgi:hypothetical protein
VKFDAETGEVLDVETHQGYGDDSCWARGQAWTVYGFPLSYRHTGDEQFLDAAKQVTEYYIDNLPEDHVPRWDFEAPEGEPRDSSAGAIAVCGLFELASHLPRAVRVRSSAAVTRLTRRPPRSYPELASARIKKVSVAPRGAAPSAALFRIELSTGIDSRKS